MTEELIAVLITVVTFATLIGFVPCMCFAQRKMRKLLDRAPRERHRDAAAWVAAD